MRSLRRSLAEYSIVHLEELARFLGLSVAALEHEELAAALAAHLISPDVFRGIYGRLSDRAREALAAVNAASPSMPWATFVRRWGPVREMGPQRLVREQPWRAPVSPAEELLYQGLVFRSMTRQGKSVVEVVYVPDELRLLLPEEADNVGRLSLPLRPEVVRPTRSRRMFLNDLVMLLAFVYNEGIQVDWEGRPLRGALAELGRRFLVPLDPTTLHRPPPRVHLLFHHARVLGLVGQEGNFLRVRPRVLARWLKQPVAYQRLTLWRAWVESVLWSDLCRVPQLDCVAPLPPGDPADARNRLLRHLLALEAEQWYSLEDLVEWVHEHDPDFLRPDGDYHSWLIRRREDGTLLRGFETWEEVEGRLIRFYIVGPMAWLDAVALDEAGEHFCLTEAGYRWLRRRSEPMRKVRPRLAVSANLRIRMAHDVHPFDLFRVSRFADWEASLPEYVYRITERSLARGRAQGLTSRHILAFLRRATGNRVPVTVQRMVKGYTQPSK